MNSLVTLGKPDMYFKYKNNICISTLHKVIYAYIYSPRAKCDRTQFKIKWNKYDDKYENHYQFKFHSVHGQIQQNTCWGSL